MRILNKVMIQHFRNIMNFSTDFSEISCLIGRNGIGKSNLLEALTYLVKYQIPKKTKNTRKTFSDNQSIIFECYLKGNEIESFEKYGLVHKFQDGIYRWEINEDGIILYEIPVSIELKPGILQSDVIFNSSNIVISILEKFENTNKEIEKLANNLIVIFKTKAELPFNNLISNFSNLSYFEEIYKYIQRNSQKKNTDFIIRLKTSPSTSSSKNFTPYSHTFFDLIRQYFDTKILLKKISAIPNPILTKPIPYDNSLDYSLGAVKSFLNSSNIQPDEFSPFDKTFVNNIFLEFSKDFNRILTNYDYIWGDQEIFFEVNQNQELEIIYRKPNGKFINYSDLSSGEQWILHFLLETYEIMKSELHGIVLIDEPGQSLYPGAQCKILEFLKDLSTKCQIIYSTHMIFLLDFDNPKSIIPLIKNQKGFLEKDEKHLTNFTILQDILEIPKDHLFFHGDKYLILEGESDVLLFRKILVCLQKDKKEIIFDDISQITKIKGTSFSKNIAKTFSRLQNHKFIAVLDFDDAGKAAYNEYKKEGLEKHVILLGKLTQNSLKKIIQIEDLIPKLIFLSTLERIYEYNNDWGNFDNFKEKWLNGEIKKTQGEIISILEKKRKLSKIIFMQNVCNQIDLKNYSEFKEVIEIFKQCQKILKCVINTPQITSTD